MKIRVVYRDSAVLAAHKPTGIATYGESKGVVGCKELLEEQLTQRLFPIHRIDADTEGLVLFALDSRAAAGMIRLFKEQRVKKTYLAWCVGSVQPQGSITKPLRKHKSEQTESARTDYQRIKARGPFSFVRVAPATGRFHQIRRHFDGIGHPLVGDPKYGDPQAWKEFFKANEEPRLMLLAESVEFQHPVQRKVVRIKTRGDGF
jgi:RluA family pseudouridine synthase